MVYMESHNKKNHGDDWMVNMALFYQKNLWLVEDSTPEIQELGWSKGATLWLWLTVCHGQIHQHLMVVFHGILWWFNRI